MGHADLDMTPGLPLMLKLFWRVLESLEPPATDKTMSTATDHRTPTLHLSGHSKPCQFPELC